MNVLNMTAIHGGLTSEEKIRNVRHEKSQLLRRIREDVLSVSASEMAERLRLYGVDVTADAYLLMERGGLYIPPEVITGSLRVLNGALVGLCVQLGRARASALPWMAEANRSPAVGGIQ